MRVKDTEQGAIRVMSSDSSIGNFSEHDIDSDWTDSDDSCLWDDDDFGCGHLITGSSWYSGASSGSDF